MPHGQGIFNRYVYFIPKKRGYWAVAVILLCHLVLVAVIVVLYISRSGQGNVLGQAWIAVAQLKNEEMENLCQTHEVLTDEVVKKLPKERGVARKRVGLVHDEIKGYVIKSLHE